ncbi:hypothetical protein E3J79_00650 [Candidatus Dependentiae bacterium]|nr:MAG: hypothetical protein E3J79_00650 [Candidatus Dependentiae bacterium]
MYTIRYLFLIFIVGIFGQANSEQKLNHKQMNQYIDCVVEEFFKAGNNPFAFMDTSVINDISVIKRKVNDSLPWFSSLSAKEIDNRFLIAITNFVTNKGYIYALQKTKDCTYAAEVVTHLKNKMEEKTKNGKKEPKELLPFLGKSLETTVDELCENYKPGAKPELR